ncbi:MAG: hydrogen peroxide-dependent heme synthase [Verrucomicrobiota bacterium]
MSLPEVKLNRGLHVIHAFYRIQRERWPGLDSAGSQAALAKLQALAGQYSAAAHPRLTCYANVGHQADLGFMIQAATLNLAAQMLRAVEACFPGGVLAPVYQYLSVTELTEYMPTEADALKRLEHVEKLAPGSEAFEKKLAEEKARLAEYSHYRLYPELPDWEVMCFYPMSKKRSGADNWYLLDFETRKRLMGSHGRTGRKYAGRIVQMITGSTGLSDWEWGVTLVAHQVDDLKDIVYEMRFDEVSARYGEFGPFYINLRLTPDALWQQLHL